MTETALVRLGTELSQLIGQQGVALLFHRGIRVAGNRYSWLLGEGALSRNEPLTGLQAKLRERPGIEARDASVFLLTEITAFLTTLIGESLTDRLVRRAWSGLHPTLPPDLEDR